MSKNAIALISYKPTSIYLDFLNNFKNYDIYIIIDDNSINYSFLSLKYTNINFVQINYLLCNNAGYKNTNLIGIRKLISGWDKALYFFTYLNTIYNNIWFVEDDVFFYDENTILNIDYKYNNYDILCNSKFTPEHYLNKWLWAHIKIQLPKPYFNGMMCACRMSQKMLECIKTYATTNKTLFFLEALFPTIAQKNNLLCHAPEELNTVTYKDVVEVNNFQLNNIYHPVKNTNIHPLIRKVIHNKIAKI
jgi:hypothetical protein